MTVQASPLHQLAAEMGISTRFRDTLGNDHVVTDDTIRALVQATGTLAGTDAQMTDALTALKADPFREIPVARSGSLNIVMPGRVNWRLTQENGTVHEGCTDGNLRLSDLPLGLHDLSIETPYGHWTTLLVSPPAVAPAAKTLTGVTRHWGMATPVYGLPGPCGLGTYAGMGDLAAGLGKLGAAYALISPVHALFPEAPEAYSPYSPSHRRFFNTAHIDPRGVPEFASSLAAQALLAQISTTIPQDGLIDYLAAAETLRPMLDALFAEFDALPPDHPRVQAFKAWCKERGAPLQRYALYEALAETHGAFWKQWPANLRDLSRLPEDAATQQSKNKHAYFQWLAEDQLSQAHAQAKAGGMALGLMLDLAVGVRTDGAETWAEPGNTAQGVSIGAPPDRFNPSGQNWALAPLNPLTMRRGGLRAFAETLCASMRNAGALRIDHVLGLRRNFWIADATGEGAYIDFPQKALFGVLAIEATRNRCLVVGEDLGNLPPGFCDEMAEGNLYGCRLLYFQRTASGGFVDPIDFDPSTVASIGSHDLATMREWWDGTDLDEMEDLDVLTGDALLRARDQLDRDRAELCDLLGLGTAPDFETLLTAVHVRLGQSGSDLVTLQLEMLLPTGARLNLPGTTVEYPNWRRRLPPVSEILNEPCLSEIASLVRKARGTS